MQLTTPAARAGARPPSEAGPGAGGEAAADPEGSRRRPRDRVPVLPAGPAGRAGSSSPGRGSARPRVHRGQHSPLPAADGLRAELGRGRPRPARLKHGALHSPPRRSESPPEAAARPSSATLTSPTRRAPPAPARPWRLPRRSPQHSGPAGAAGTPGTRSEGEEGRGARSFPRPVGLSGRSGRPGGGREGGREGAEERKEEGRGGGGAGRDEQSPRPAAAWKLPPPWRGREGVRAAHRGSAGPAPAARGLPV